VKYLYIIIFLLIQSFLFSNNTLDFINNLEKKYEIKIIDTIKSLYPNKKYDVKVLINLIDKTKNIDNNRNNSHYKIIVNVFIEYNYEFVYNEKGLNVLNSNGTRKRNIIDLNQNEINKIENCIKNLIDYRKENDSILVQSFIFNRDEDFLTEDTQWKRKEKTTLVLFSFLVSIISLIFFTLIAKVVINEIKRRKKIISQNNLKNLK